VIIRTQRREYFCTMASVSSSSPLMIQPLSNLSASGAADDADDNDETAFHDAQQQQQQPHEHEPREYSLAAVALIFSVPALAGFGFGYDIGATSYAIVQMQSSDYSGVSWYESVANSPTLQGTIVSAASAGALAGSTLMFGIADHIGRKRELQAGAILYVCGAALQFAAGRLDFGKVTSTVMGLTVLLTGRLVYGLGIGISMHGAPTYLAEMGPSRIRGFLVSMKEAAIVCGMLAGYTLGFIFSKTKGGWAWTYACSAGFAMVMLGLSFWIPQSCRWLLLKGREEEALQSLRFVFDEHDAIHEFEEMKRLHESTTPSPNRNTDDGDLSVNEEDCDDNDHDHEESTSIWDKSHRAPLVAGVGLVVLQQVTGQPSVLSYATPIFRDAGLSDYSSVLVAAFKLVATLTAAGTVETYGRQKLLYTGCTLMLVALTVLSVSFGRDAPGVQSMILLSMFVYIGGYQVGFGPISWLIISEVFPLSVRGQAVALAVQMNFFLNAVVQFGVPVLESAIGLNFTFGIFAVLTAYR
jgi:sugar porter (SP) family MFS transporter